MNLLSFGENIWDSYGDSFTIGGAPLNLAAHYAIQGGDAWLASAVGNDVLGTRATEHIKALGLKTDYVSVLDGLQTGECVVTLDEKSVPKYNILENVACADAYDLIAQNYPKIKLILITQGEMGSTCYDCQNKKIYTCKAEPVTAVSTVGAGDSYGATFLTQYLKANDIMLSMALASKVSAFVVSHQEAIPNDTKEFIKSVVRT